MVCSLSLYFIACVLHVFHDSTLCLWGSMSRHGWCCEDAYLSVRFCTVMFDIFAIGYVIGIALQQLCLHESIVHFVLFDMLHWHALQIMQTDHMGLFGPHPITHKPHGSLWAPSNNRQTTWFSLGFPQWLTNRMGLFGRPPITDRPHGYLWASSNNRQTAWVSLGSLQ